MHLEDDLAFYFKTKDENHVLILFDMQILLIRNPWFESCKA